MRKFLTLLFIVGCFTAYSAPKIKLKVTNGSWTASHWDLNRVPRSGDTIVIPANHTLALYDDLTLNNVLMDVAGNLVLTGNTKVNLDNAIEIWVRSGGVIRGDKNSQHIRLGLAGKIFEGLKNIVFGPMKANASTDGFIFMPEAVTPLPVKFLGFSATRKSADVLVQWATSQEINAAFYEIQHSEDGLNWKAVGTIRAAGNTNYTTHYSFTDKRVAQKTVYYRIKQVDADGGFEYTAIKTVKGDTNATINAIATNGNIVLQFSREVTGQVEVRLVSLSGRIVSRQYLNRPVGQVVIPAAVKGHFVLTVSDQQDLQMNKQILL